MRSVIFDFNGTMFMDSALHRAAWKRYTKKLGFSITDEEFMEYMYGPTNHDIFEWLYKRELPQTDIDRMSEEKEAEYRAACAEHPEAVRLTEGLTEALDRMCEMGVNMTIATGAIRRNVDFYMEIFGLGRWFEYDRIVCDDGTVPEKPNPEIYIRAAKMLGKRPEECLVVEDSMAGYRSARGAGCGIIMMDSSLGYDRAAALAGVERVIHDFRGFERFL